MVDVSKLIRKKSEGLLSQMFNLDVVDNVVSTELATFQSKLPQAIANELSVSELCALYIYSAHKNEARFKVWENADKYTEKFDRYIRELDYTARQYTSKDSDMFKKLCFKFGFDEQSVTLDDIGYILASVAAYHRGNDKYIEPSDELKQKFDTQFGLTQDTSVARFISDALKRDLYAGIKELSLFTDSIGTPIDWVVEQHGISNLVRYYVAVAYDKINTKMPDKDLLRAYLINNVNDWRGQVERELHESYPKASSVYAAAYRRAYKNREGNFYDRCTDTVLAEKLYDLAGKPDMHNWYNFTYQNDVIAEIEQEIRNMYRSIGLDLDDVLPTGIDNCLLFYAFWIGRGYAYDKLVGRTHVCESYR